MTSYDDVRAMVAESTYTDWIRFANRGTWTYQPDVSLRLVRENQIDQQYQQPWTNQIQGMNARFGYYLYYDSSPVEYHVIVSIDDGRAHIPEPTPPQSGGQYTISEYEGVLGRIVTGDAETFNAYLSRTGIDVRE
jgi:hypothetical protein